MSVNYPISVSEDWSVLQAQIAQLNPDKIFVLVDENSHKDCYPILSSNLALDFITIVIQSGETNKNIDTCQKIWTALLEAEASRKSLILNLGGGVIGDMGGFCAASFKRGIPFIQIPTTLLSMVDASVGSKLGIDMLRLKNVVGLFADPQAVFVYSPFLKTLAHRELRSGFAEVIKHALIFDEDYWCQIKSIKTLSKDIAWGPIIQRSIDIKSNVVSEDPLEKGLRKILNFGHTVGHALESHYLDAPSSLLHGEAIAIGMIIETSLAKDKRMLSAPQLEEISNFICSFYSDIIRTLPALNQLSNALKQDKKNEGQGLLFSLLTNIGSCDYNVLTNLKELQSSLDWFNNHLVPKFE